MNKTALATISLISLLLTCSVTAVTVKELKKIVASDAKTNDGFGRVVSISGECAIVGVPFEDTNGARGGAAYIFCNTSGTWTQIQKIQSSDIEADDRFGFSVSIDGDYTIVGAYNEDTGASNAGAAYIFNNTGGTWTQVQKIQANDLAADDYFGKSVSISGDYAVVGANYEDDAGVNAGAAYVFKKNTTGGWEEIDKPIGNAVESNDDYGVSVGISGDYIIVGADDDTGGGVAAGAAYIFKKNATDGWDEVNQLLASDALPGDYVGYSVSISGDYAVVGAYFQDTGGVGAGAAYIFKRNATDGWEEVQKIQANDKEAQVFFGTTVSISGDYIIVGCTGVSSGAGQYTGAAYLFKRNSTDQFNQVKKIMASDAEALDSFGSASISGNVIIVGAINEDSEASNAGAAYIYEIDESPPPFVEIELSEPLTNTNVSQNNFFDVILNLTCVNGPCEAINVSLFYANSTPYNWTAVYNITENNPNKAYFVGRDTYRRGADTPRGPLDDRYAEYLSADYSNVQASDDSRTAWVSALPGANYGNNWINLLFKYSLADANSINNLTLLWEGYDTLAEGDDFELDIWNFTSQMWVVLNQTTTAQAVDVNWGAVLTSGFDDFIQNNTIYVGISGEYTAEGGGGCAFVYSYDGQKYTPEVAISDFAVHSLWEYTTYGLLPSLVGINGTYHLGIWEQVPETQYMDTLELWKIIHPQGTLVVPEQGTGVLHTIAEKQYPISAKGTDGNSYLSNVSFQDTSYWVTNISTVNLSEPQMWDYLELGFNASATNLTKLVIRGKDTGFLTENWGVMVTLIEGPGAMSYNLLNTNFSLIGNVTNWAMSQGLLQVYQKINGDFEYITSVPFGNPEFYHTFALPLVQTSGDVEIRLVGTPYGQQIDEVYIDQSPDLSLSLTKLKPHVTRTNTGINATDIELKLNEKDGDYLALPLGDYFEADFYDNLTVPLGSTATMLVVSDAFSESYSFEENSAHTFTHQDLDLANQILTNYGLERKLLLRDFYENNPLTTSFPTVFSIGTHTLYEDFTSLTVSFGEHAFESVSTVAPTTPLYTNKPSNPVAITLDDGESQLVTFSVNATGPNASTFELKAQSMLLNYSNRVDESNRVNVTIIQGLAPPPDTIPPSLNWNWADINSTIPVNYTTICVNASENVNCTLFFNGTTYVNSSIAKNICWLRGSLLQGNYTTIYAKCQDGGNNTKNTSIAWLNVSNVSSSGSPIQISPGNCTELRLLIEADCSADYTLQNDLDCTGESGLTPICRTVYYGGTFDGQGHNITGVLLDNSTLDYIGLFGHVNGSIINFGLIDINVSGASYVGGLVGQLGKSWPPGSGGLLNNTFVSGVVTGSSGVGCLTGVSYRSNIDNSYSNCNITGNDNVGGIVGYMTYSSVDNTHTVCKVTGNDAVGGFAGLVSWDSVINNSYSISNVTGNNYVGGFAGKISQDSKVTRSFSLGSVNATSLAGGFVGQTDMGGIIDKCYTSSDVLSVGFAGGFAGDHSWSSVINNSYSTGSVSGNNSVGGLVAYSENAIVTNSYAIGTVIGNESVGGLFGQMYANSKADNSYSTGSVIGNNNVGGLVGANAGGELNMTYWLNRTTDSAITCIGNNTGSCDLAPFVITTESFFYDTSNPPMDVWDFTNIWCDVFDTTDYPILQWQSECPVEVVSYCGDGTCDSNETCGNCEVDCGACSSGGGSCNKDWECASWGVCVNGKQTRACTCDCDHDKDCSGNHDEVRSCTSDSTETGSEEGTENSGSEESPEESENQSQEQNPPKTSAEGKPNMQLEGEPKLDSEIDVIVKDSTGKSAEGTIEVTAPDGTKSKHSLSNGRVPINLGLSGTWEFTYTDFEGQVVTKTVSVAGVPQEPKEIKPTVVEPEPAQPVKKQPQQDMTWFWVLVLLVILGVFGFLLWKKKH